MIRLSQSSFFGGQLDFEMMGRQDYQRYSKGATKLCNFNIMKRGGLDKRRGFDRIMDLTTTFANAGVTANTKFRAIPFAYTKTQGFVLLMSASKCIVVGTNSVNQFKYYNVDDLDGVYTAQEIQELDYQQCGDVLFIAHQNHPPARIVHDISYGEDGFHYEQLDLNQRNNGIPSITSSTVTRLPVTDAERKASLFTEKYKATAVFDGVETFPCSEFSSVNADPWGASSWPGTNYPMPWTESQKISLSISANSRVGEDGSEEYPEEIRIYKKSYNYYGLVGVVKISQEEATRYAFSEKTSRSSFTRYQNASGTGVSSTDNLFSTSQDLAKHGKNSIGYVIGSIGTNSKFTISKETGRHYSTSIWFFESFKIRVSLGCCYKTISDGIVTMNYSGWNAGSVNVACKCSFTDQSQSYTDVFNTASHSKSLPNSIGSKSIEVQKESGESQSDYIARVETEFDNFCNSIKDISEISIPVSISVDRYLGSYPYNVEHYFELSTSSGNATINNICKTYGSNVGNVTFDDNYITPDTSTTPPEKDETEDVFVGEGNYPASVSLSQQRLIWASSKNDPARVWMSEIGDFYTYNTHEIQTAQDSIDFTLPVTRFAKINHICEMRKLLMFNSACEWLVDSASTVQGLTYETIQAYPQSYSGSSERLKPIICNNSLIFCERTGQAVRRFAYDISNDGFAGRDVSILSCSIFENNSIVDWTYQQFPYSTLWCAMADGNLASFEFMEEQDIMAWMTHKLGGNGKICCLATSYAVSPAMDDVEDVDVYNYATHEEVFAVIKRGNSLWLERMRVRSKPAVGTDNHATDSIYHSLCLDGCRVLNSTNGYTPTEETGAVWIPADTTTGATITRNEALAKIAAGVDVYEGFPFDAEYQSVYPNINNGNIGYGQFDIKHIQGCGVRLMTSFGGGIKPVGSQFYEPIPYFYNDPENDHRAVFANGNVTLYNHDTNIMSLSGVNNRDGRVFIKQSDPYPFSILSYEIEFEPESVSYGGRL